MHVAMISFHAKADRVEEVTKRARILLKEAGKFPGFREAYLLEQPDSCRFVGLSFWDSTRAAEALGRDPVYCRLMDELEELVVECPHRQQYEVIMAGGMETTEAA